MGMQIAVAGFSQEAAVKLGLNAEDMIILDWFVKFWPSDKMIKMTRDGKTYGLVKYSGFAEQLPIVSCNKRTIARKFVRLVEAGVLEHMTIKEGGSYSVYRFGPSYDSLCLGRGGGGTEIDNPYKKCTTGGTEIDDPMSKNVQPNTKYTNTKMSILEKESIEKERHTAYEMADRQWPIPHAPVESPERPVEASEAPGVGNHAPQGQPPPRIAPESKQTRFVPPTVEECEAYCREKGYAWDPEAFVDFYDSKGWMVGKSKMKDWKASMRNWNRGESRRLASKPSMSQQASTYKAAPKGKYDDLPF